MARMKRMGKRKGHGRKMGGATHMRGGIHTQMNTPFMAGKGKRGRKRGKKR